MEAEADVSLYILYEGTLSFMEDSTLHIPGDAICEYVSAILGDKTELPPVDGHEWLVMQHCCALIEAIHPSFYAIRQKVEKAWFDELWTTRCDSEEKVTLFIKQNAMRDVFVKEQRVLMINEPMLNLFDNHNPTWAPPRFFFNMPLCECPPELIRQCPVDKGKVSLFYTQIKDWAWYISQRFQRMVRQSAMMRSDFYIKNAGKYAHPLAAIFGQCAAMIDAYEKRQRAGKRKRNLADGSYTDLGDIEDLADFSKRTMPPCVAAIVYNGLELHHHPKHRERYHLISFLMEQGMDGDKAEAILLQLYRAEFGRNYTLDQLRAEASQLDLINSMSKGDKHAPGCENRLDCNLCAFNRKEGVEPMALLEWMDVDNTLADMKNNTITGGVQSLCGLVRKHMRPQIYPIDIVTHPGQWVPPKKEDRKVKQQSK